MRQIRSHYGPTTNAQGWAKRGVCCAMGCEEVSQVWPVSQSSLPQERHAPPQVRARVRPQ